MRERERVNQLGPKEVGGRQALLLYSSDEPGELSHWPCRDDSTLDIVSHYYYYYCYMSKVNGHLSCCCPLPHVGPGV